MKLSTKGRYAVMAMIDIAKYQDQDKYISLYNISKRNVSYLEQLFIKLRKASLVESVKGSKGGYRLGRNADSIFILDIVSAVDEKIELLRCDNKGVGCTNNNKLCESHDLWSNLMININDYLGSISLLNVLNHNISVQNAQNRLNALSI
jgi:Rrf2 family iron-sulfur cluster assembly transcriptional regulator